MQNMLQPPALDNALETLITLAVREDVGTGDRTVQHAIPRDLPGKGDIVARKPGVISGTFLITPILSHYDPQLLAQTHIADGSRVASGDVIASISGPAGALLSAERVLLNFMCHLSGIATLTALYVDTVAQAVPDPTRRPAICDTRKTIPAFRMLDKYAVRCGGGTNHRMALYDGVMLKDNHLAALRERLGHGLTLAQLTRRVREEVAPELPLWLEVDTLEQLRQELALPAEQSTSSAIPAPQTGGADIILLDNFTPRMMRDAVVLRNHALKLRGGQSKILLEASGGITLQNLAEVAQTGVDRISIGAITHSAPVLDLSMEFA